MASITSTSTDAEVRAAYDDNAGYAEDADVTKARAFETACRVLLRREPTQIGRAGNAIALDKTSIREELAQVRKWLASRGSANSGGSSSRHYSFETLR